MVGKVQYLDSMLAVYLQHVPVLAYVWTRPDVMAQCYLFTYNSSIQALGTHVAHTLSFSCPCNLFKSVRSIFLCYSV